MTAAASPWTPVTDGGLSPWRVGRRRLAGAGAAGRQLPARRARRTERPRLRAGATPPHNALQSYHVTREVNGLAAVPLRCAFGSAPVTSRGPTCPEERSLRMGRSGIPS